MPHRENIRPLTSTPVRLLAATATLVVLAAASCAETGLDPERLSRVESTGPDVALEWGRMAYEVAWAEDRFLTFKGQRSLAMMHLAIHDALQAIVPVFEPFALQASRPGADPIAAAARAAHGVLVAAYPDRAVDLDALLAKWLDRVPEGPARAEGNSLGEASGRAIIALRDGDDWDRPGAYEYRTDPGQYRTTPPWDGFTLQPGFRHARPFSFDDPARFRPPPPPALSSAAYAEALNEVRLQGDSLSEARTADQTGYAVWWMEFSEGTVGKVMRRLLRERGTNLWTANRALAHLYVALFDGYVSNWDSKYEYNHWRPYTAIRAAAEDGNPATSPDPDWVPLRPTPPFPEYASAHATGCAAAFAVAASALGDATPFEHASLTAPPDMPTRSFGSFGAAAQECADSRVRLGWHYRYATEAGLEAGRRVAQHVLSTTLRAR